MEYREVLDEYWNIVDNIYGTYLDCLEGFREIVRNTQELEDDVQKNYEQFQEKTPKFKETPLGNIRKSYGRVVKKEDKDKPRHLHDVGTSDLIERNSEGGRNGQFVANLAIVSIYQYWEDHYRGDFANSLGIEKADVVSPIFGDLRLLRRSIIHNKGRAIPEIDKCEIVKYFSSGDQINFSKIMFEEIIDEIKVAVGSLQDEYE